MKVPWWNQAENSNWRRIDSQSNLTWPFQWLECQMLGRWGVVLVKWWKGRFYLQLHPLSTHTGQSGWDAVCRGRFPCRHKPVVTAMATALKVTMAMVTNWAKIPQYVLVTHNWKVFTHPSIYFVLRCGFFFLRSAYTQWQENCFNKILKRYFFCRKLFNPTFPFLLPRTVCLFATPHCSITFVIIITIFIVREGWRYRIGWFFWKN